jgi:hypothetical protein
VVQVLGLADEPFDLLNQELKSCLIEYYKVNNMHNYDELVRGYFTIDMEKLTAGLSNEYWPDERFCHGF